jgi:hypothetical protein
MLRVDRFRLRLGQRGCLVQGAALRARDVSVSDRLRSREPEESGNAERAAVSVARSVWGSFG